ncbi:type II toxin-antitoxin system HigB family toxin [Pseudolysobacter antarcticus]|uniref:Type II toxin-antitoxin system HigB family toxin n=1 Tax=Pseudolysobacter antarcticus TaxID=2511995 RepID=A0A411HHB9_9GAMM|nr:type II toxin-antitoxin system HigB family toxin [Pseudolysobacter antarcticus]QBB69915.1 type II toxin-antitoxin system HigB family toxin [Pseudolysobacter antarcticus]
MRIISRSTLQAFSKSRAARRDAKAPIDAWFKQAHEATWQSPADVKASFGTASILLDGRVVFNIAGNKYRLIVWINYAYSVVYVRFIGTHKEYDAIDAQTI